MLSAVAGDWDTPQQRLRLKQDFANADPVRHAFEDFDYSTPEAQRAFMLASTLLLDIRDEYVKPTSRKIALYERTLGLAVLPVLLRRCAIVLARKVRERRRSLR
jgi:hypothetical protein